MPAGQNPPIGVSVHVCDKEMIVCAQQRKKVSPVHWRFLQLRAHIAWIKEKLGCVPLIQLLITCCNQTTHTPLNAGTACTRASTLSNLQRTRWLLLVHMRFREVVTIPHAILALLQESPPRVSHLYISCQRFLSGLCDSRSRTRARRYSADLCSIDAYSI